MPDCTLIIPFPTTPAHITFRLHTQHLSAKSPFLRGLLRGVAPLDLIRDLSASRLHPSVPLRIPPSRLPRLLSSSPSHPVVFLPVPDPYSIQPLFHWMYFGNTDHIEDALDQGLIQWEGLARNVEYLCLPTDIKVFLGRWYRDCILPEQCSPDHTPCPADDGQSDLDSDCSPSTPPSSDDECNRGRAQDVKPLV